MSRSGRIGFCCLVILALCTGCTGLSNTTPEIPTTPASGVVSQKLPPEPVVSSTRWQMADQPVIANENLSITVYAMSIGWNETMLIYSASGAGADKLTKPGAVIQVRDDAGKIDEIVLINVLATVDQTNFGIMRFEPRHLGAKELILQVSLPGTEGGDGDEFVEAVLAELIRPPEDPAVFVKRTYSMGAIQVFEQNHLRVSFGGWMPPQIPADKIPTIPNLPEGVSDFDRATLKIEKPDENRIFYLYMQFLTNGEIISAMIE